VSKKKKNDRNLNDKTELTDTSKNNILMSLSLRNSAKCGAESKGDDRD